MLDQSTVNVDVPSVRRILTAARECFGQLGYKGASMNRIAREAEVSKSLLHYHFDCKENLFVAVQLMLLRELLDQIRTLTGGPSTVEQFTLALDRVMDFVEAEVADFRILLEFHQQAATNPAIAQRLVVFNDQVNKLVVDGIHNILGPMTERLFIPPERLARLLRTMFDGLILHLAYAPDDTDKEIIRETFADARALIAQALLKEVI